MNQSNLDILIVGGGLQGGLVALAVLERNPGARLLVVEAGPGLGGNHTWCFHADDLSPSGVQLLAPLIEHRWSGYDVEFPSRSRSVGSAYAAVTSERFAEHIGSVLESAPNATLITGVAVRQLGERSVELEDGRRFEAGLVIDARGPDRFEPQARVAYQKFLGLELELEADHGLTRPTLMDCRVPQTDGFRFFYVLPLGARRVLVEDTYYSDTSALDSEALRREVLAYAAAHELRVSQVLREERGVLPIPARAIAEPSAELPLALGYRGGWFHPTTGYSLPPAVRVALHVADHFDGDLFGPAWRALCREHRRQQRFFLWLNRLLFAAFHPEDRWHVLARFYGLPEPTIARFYAMTTTAADRARILCGRPPRGFSVRTALSQGATT
ncbi:MAG: lycopene beta-cyclase CrtY [Myxococcales bacterium]|nr:lycopene beta-cyclase CrtY [Myxococcales bacterium]